MSTSSPQKWVVIYTRYSSDMQRADSCEIQERRVREELVRLGIPAGNARVLRDEAVSGTDETRSGYQTLLRWCDERRISVLAVYDLSRLSRGKVKGLVEDVRFHGGRFIAVGDHIDTDRDGWELPLDFGQIHNAVSNKDTARRVRSGLEHRLRDGHGSNGNFPYGYRSEYREQNWIELLAAGQKPKKDVVIFESEAEVVRQILTMYADQKLSLNRIAREMRERGAPLGIRGRKWSHKRIEKIIANERYIGRWQWGLTEVVRDSQGKKKQRPADPSRVTVVERPLLRIVDDDLWNRTQARRKAMQTAYNVDGRSPIHPRHLYPKCNLSGLVRCGVCGRVLVLATNRTTRHKYQYLFCPSQKHGECTQRRQLSVPLAEKALFDFLAAVCGQWPDWLAAVKAEVERTIQQLGSRVPEELAACRSQAAALDKQIANLLDKLSSISGTSQSLADRLVSLEQERAVLLEREVKLKSQNRMPRQLPDEVFIRSELGRLPELLTNSCPATADLVRRIFTEIVAVEVRRPGRKRTHIVLRANISPAGFLMAALGSDWEQRLADVGTQVRGGSGSDGIQLDIPVGMPGKYETAAPTIDQMRTRGIGWEEIATAVGIERQNCIRLLRQYRKDLRDMERSN